jgi:hypothetical protein
VDESMKGSIKVLVVLTGVESPYMFDSTGSFSIATKTAVLKGLDWGRQSLKNYYKFFPLYSNKESRISHTRKIVTSFTMT